MYALSLFRACRVGSEISSREGIDARLLGIMMHQRNRKYIEESKRCNRHKECAGQHI